MTMREESAFSGEPADVRPRGKPENRIPVLDGWRATSILLVLGAHLVPLGPHWLALNDTAGAMGMALFFTLSGFLITSFLAGGMPVGDFLARRLARIIPLCWVAVTVLIFWHRYDLITILRNFLFVANLPPVSLLEGGEHLWSLGVEMQFYVTIALICLILGRRGLYLVPVLAIGVTAARIIAGERISIVTWHRIDEILAGGMIALIYAGWYGERIGQVMKWLPIWPMAILCVLCSHPAFGPMMYFRPYAAAFLVGASLGNCPDILRRVLVSRPMAYVAEISYALYVIHGVLSATWLGSGGRTAKYLKRPLLFGATFLLAHISTRYYEQPITRRVRDWTKARRRRREEATTSNRSAAASRPAG